MTDRELLELAAKAIGRCLHRNTRDEHGNWGTDTYCTDCGKGTYGEHWNPLTADGDALRLAVKLYIGVRSHGPDHWQQPNVAVALWDFDDKAGRVTVEHGDDHAAATRLAIVRAAAAIGKAMP